MAHLAPRVAYDKFPAKPGRGVALTTTPTSTHKRCSSCATVKPRSEFHACRRHPDGLQSRCKACNTASAAAWKRKRYPPKPRPTRTCTTCNEAKPFGAFRDPRTSQCLECRRIEITEQRRLAATTRDARNAAARRKWDEARPGYNVLHNWLRRHTTKTGHCSECGKEAKTDWANLSGQYHRDADDYRELCRPCHARFDTNRRADTGKPTTIAFLREAS